MSLIWKQITSYFLPLTVDRIIFLFEQIKNPLASFFGSSMNGGMPAFVLRIPTSFSFSSPRQIQTENLSNETEEIESRSEPLSFSDMFSRMHEQMNSMMSNMMHGMPSLSGMGVPEGARGKMVVVKSGPGFSETKTYDINPDGSRTEVESEVTHNGQVISHENLRMNDMSKFCRGKDTTEIMVSQMVSGYFLSEQDESFGHVQQLGWWRRGFRAQNEGGR